MCHNLRVSVPLGSPGPDGLSRDWVRAKVGEIIGVIARSGDRPLSDDSRLAEDLGLDSLGLIEFAVVAEKLFGLPTLNLEQALAVLTVRDAVDLILAHECGVRP
jgi:acyl carrier protein